MQTRPDNFSMFFYIIRAHFVPQPEYSETISTYIRIEFVFVFWFAINRQTNRKMMNIPSILMAKIRIDGSCQPRCKLMQR